MSHLLGFEMIASELDLGDPPGGPEDGDDSNLKNWSSLIGIISAIVGNVLIALALNVQRYAHIRLHQERASMRDRAKSAERRAKLQSSDSGYGSVGASRMNGTSHDNGDASRNGGYTTGADEDAESQPLIANGSDREPGAEPPSSSYLKSPYWWLGQVLITLGEIGNFLAYGFAPASIVSPLGVVALVSNCVIAPILFHEKFRQRDFWGVIIAVSGVVIVVLSANQEETKLDPHDVWLAITTLEFKIYMAVTISLIVLLMWASPRYGRRTILIDLGLVGLFGGYTALSTKGVSSMLSSTLFRAFTTPVTYALLFILLSTAVMQVRYVNKALQRFDSTQVIPIQFVMFTLCVIIGSAILYRDFERTTAAQAVKFVWGCLLTFYGVFLITSGRSPQHAEDDLSDAEGVEETIGLAEHDRGLAPHASSISTPSRRSSRSSRVGFADGTMPGRSYSLQHDSGVPSLRIPNSIAATSVKPAGEEDLSSTLENPWQNSLMDMIVPLESDAALESGTTPSAVDQPATEPSTPVQQTMHIPPPADHHGSTPKTSHVSASGRLHGRHYAGPLISPSPLSSAVSAVMKDTLRRHDESPLSHKTSLGRIRSSLRASLFMSDEDYEDGLEGRHRSSIFGELLEPNEVEGEVDDTRIPREEVTRRTRSLSDTIGDFFRTKRRDEDEERGDSSYDEQSAR